MTRVAIEIVGIDPLNNCEAILAQNSADRYSPDYLAAQIEGALDQAIRTLHGSDEEVLRPWQPQVSIGLSADDEEHVRPSVHLSAGLLQRFVRAGASFDFDPYV